MKNLPRWLQVILWIILILCAVFIAYIINPWQIFRSDRVKQSVSQVTAERQKCYDDSVLAANVLRENERLKEIISNQEAQHAADSLAIISLQNVEVTVKDNRKNSGTSVDLNPLTNEMRNMNKRMDEQSREITALRKAKENHTYVPTQQQPVREEPRARAVDPVVAQRNVVTEGTNDGVNERLTNGGPSLSPTNTVFSQYRLSVIFGNDSLLTYSFTKEAYEAAGGNETPELNNRGTGKFFTLVGDSLYVYKDPSRKGRPGSRIRQGFTAYIGDGKGWPAFLVHELMKPIIVHALGSTGAGYITPEVLRKMAEIEPMIRAGKLLPNRPAVRQLPDSANHWEGWYYSE